MPDKTNRSKTERRDFLKQAVILGSSGSAFGIAGCSGLVGDDDDGDGGGDGGDGGGDGGDGGGQTGERIPEIEFQVHPEGQFPNRFEGGQICADAYRELGLAIDFWGPEASTLGANYADEVYKGEPMMLQLAYGPQPRYLDPSFFMNFFVEGSTNNKWDWSNDDYNQMYQEQLATFDFEDRKAITDEMQMIFGEEQPATLTWYGDRVNMYNGEKFNSVKQIPGQAINNFWQRVYPDLAGDATTVRWGATGFPETLNPLDPTIGRGEEDWLSMIYDRLMRINLDAEPVPWAAESYEWVDDTTLAITLRDDMQFHDGEDVTAEDVQLSYNFHLENQGKYTPQVETIESVDIDSDYELTFNLSQPDSSIIYTGITQVMIVPAHIWSDLDNPFDYANEEPIGSGPMMFQAYQLDEAATLAANENHFEPPSLEEEIQIAYTDVASMYRGLEVGENDAATGVSPGNETIERLQGVEGIGTAQSKAHGMTFHVWDTNTQPFDDLAFREALSWATPTSDVIEIVYNGRATPADSPITEANERWHNPDMPKPKNDMEMARQVLEEAGYWWDDDDRLHYPE